MSSRSFPALDIRFTPEAEGAFELRDRLIAGLDDYQPTAIEESTAIWRVFFDCPASRDHALAWLRGLADPRITGEALEVDDEDWARRSQSDLTPVRAGCIVATPPWCAEEAREAAGNGDIVVVVAPSTGFGTGHHASTRLCLALLQEIDLLGRTVLDIGTGSGILAIAASRLGAHCVLAIDNDVDAIEAARENVALNGVRAGVRLEARDFRASAAGRADVVVANLTGESLRRSARDIVARASAGGTVIVSGVLAEEQARVVAVFRRAGAQLVATRAEDEWVGLRFEVVDS